MLSIPFGKTCARPTQDLHHAFFRVDDMPAHHTSQKLFHVFITIQDPRFETAV